MYKCEILLYNKLILIISYMHVLPYVVCKYIFRYLQTKYIINACLTERYFDNIGYEVV